LAAERERIRLFNHQQNLEREKRKRNWKKYDIIAKEQLQGEQIKKTRALTAEMRQSRRETEKVICDLKERTDMTFKRLKGVTLTGNKEAKNYLLENLRDVVGEAEVAKLVEDPRKKKKKEEE